MLNIIKKYIVDEDNNRLAVEIDIDTFNKIEEIIEDYGLYRLMTDDNDTEMLDLDEAKRFYSTLDKD
ncbi:MAG: hypothetical protein HQL03_05870 [Nitrospirae bacterium]|nr:hypothetical protein [Nitrospirota bacterium]MBF0591576.1 hypothetical protein [Nitrospirota bacterium]